MSKIKEFKKEIRLLNKIIAEQKVVIELLTELKLKNINTTPITFNSPLTCQHEYPQPWFGTLPPSCKKCGAPAYNLVITSSNTPVNVL